MDNNNIANSKIDNDEKIIKDLMKESVVTPSDNLKYRIMHQIQTEKILTTQTSKSKYINQPNVIKSFGIIFGITYLLIIVLFAIFKLTQGSQILSSNFFITIVLILSVTASSVWFFVQLDNWLRIKKGKEAKN
jgi:hypothetical protein